MSDTPWTPGPWTIGVVEDDDASWFEVRGAPDNGGWMTVIADMVDHVADARLIAAAPDMAEALNGLLGLLDAGSLYEPQVVAARAALARARGEQHG